ncbi:hypothetical protein D3C80_2100030 [compost metagenome]
MLPHAADNVGVLYRTTLKVQSAPLLKLALIAVLPPSAAEEVKLLNNPALSVSVPELKV